MNALLRCTLLALLLVGPSRALAQNLPAPQGNVDNSGAYLGSSVCRQCHSPGAQGFDDRKEFYLQNEYPVWKEQDPHSRAFEVLSSPTTRQMEEALGWKPGQAKTEQSCLVCHANPEVKGNPEHLAEGVSCELCHGPAKNWLGPHLDPAFRTADARRWEELGFRDIVHPQGRAEMCSGCHVGDEKRRVTHDMYAAGHPPLPAFELSLFMTRIPRHWKDLRDMPEPVRKHRNFDTNPMVALQDACAGSLISLERTTRAFAAGEGPEGSRIVAGFESYDCYSCHHELRNTDSLRRPGFGIAGEDFFDWRQSADPSLPPGRLRVPQWPYEIPELIAQATSQRVPLTPVRIEFMAQVGSGRVPGQLAPLEWSQSVRKELFDGRVRFDEAAADAFVNAAIERGIREPMTFDSARIVAGSLRAVLRDRYPSLDTMPDAVAAVKTLEDELSLNVDWPERPADPSAQEGPVVTRLPDLARKRTDYRPRVVRDALKSLQAHLRP